MFKFSTLSTFEFQRQFTDVASCLAYLADLKWEAGCQCCKCSYQHYTKGYYPFARRCQQCRYDESATAHTIFHNLKFNLFKAFYGVFSIVKRKVFLLRTGQRNRGKPANSLAVPL